MANKVIHGYYHTTGGRKESKARVFMKGGTGKITVNNREIHEYFNGDTLWKNTALQSLNILQQADLFDIKITVKGGGVSGQAAAVRHGIAKALDLYAAENMPSFSQAPEEEAKDEEGEEGESEGGTTWRKVLRKAGYLTRDDRKVLRKKVGLVKARKAKQFSKR